MTERLILMGVIGKPHGVNGLARVHAFTGDAASLPDYPLVDKAGRSVALQWTSGDVARLTIAGRPVTDRTEAERLVNTELFAPRSALPAAAEDEFYLADLVGLAARNEAGETLGTIAAVHDYGAGPSLEILPASLIVPFTRAAVPEVNVAAGYAVVNPPAEAAA